jgi:hypothetical protein
MAFLRRKINLTFQLGKGQFGEGGFDQIDVEGLRITAKIVRTVGFGMGSATVDVFGLPRSVMNQLATLGPQITMIKLNKLVVTAGDDENGMGTVFEGQISNAWIDLQAAPMVPFHVLAYVGAFDQVKPLPPSSYRGGADVATILSGLATKMGIKFENNGVQRQVSNPYYTGSARDQAIAVVQDAGVEWNNMELGVLAIWNPGQGRGGAVPLVSKDTGLVGYPVFTSQGITLKIVMNPSISIGSMIELETEVTATSNAEGAATSANGRWRVYAMNLDLASEVPGGPWFAEIAAQRPSAGPVVPQVP